MILYIFILFVVIAFGFYILQKGSNQVKEHAGEIPDTQYAPNILNQAIPAEPSIEKQIGTTTITEQMMNNIGAESQ